MADDQLCVDRLRRKIAQCEQQAHTETYDNFLQWGAALMELSVYEENVVAQARLGDAIHRLNQALDTDENNRHHENIWLLGCAHAYRQEVTPEGDDERQRDKDRSVKFFSEAKTLQPTNELYIRSTQSAIQAFFRNRYAWGAVAASVFGCVCKFAFNLARKGATKEAGKE